MAVKEVEVTWLGHSNVMVRGGGATFFIDPFFRGNPAAPDWRSLPKPDAILVTHSHGDHLGQAVEIAKATGAKVVCIYEMAEWLVRQGLAPGQVVGGNVGGATEERGVRLTQTFATHSSSLGAPVGFVLQFPGGPTLYHAGDTGLFGDMALIGRRFAPSLAMVPVGGVYTMDGEDAAQACLLLGAKAALPMHYATFPSLAPDAEGFKAAVGRLCPGCRVVAPRPGEPFTVG